MCTVISNTKMSTNTSDLVIFMLSVSFVGAHSEHLDSFIVPQGSQNGFGVAPLRPKGQNSQHTILSARDL